jgi:hypothetical protein
VSTVIVRVELLNVPSHPKAKTGLYIELRKLMRASGYSSVPELPIGRRPVEYANRGVAEHKPLDQIAAALKALVNAVHTPSKVWVRKGSALSTETSERPGTCYSFRSTDAPE